MRAGIAEWLLGACGPSGALQSAGPTVDAAAAACCWLLEPGATFASSTAADNLQMQCESLVMFSS